MTPLLLTLASLTPGDGGPGGGAAREAVAWKLGEGFSGYLRLPAGPLREVRLRDRMLEVSGRWGESGFFAPSLAPDGAGRFRLAYGREVVKGTVRHDGGKIVLTVDPPPLTPEPGAILLRRLVDILEAAPPKP